jgi:IS4 transposase
VVDIENRACFGLGLFDDPLLGNAAVLLLCDRDEHHRHGRGVDVWSEGPFEGTTSLRSRHEKTKAPISHRCAQNFESSLARIMSAVAQSEVDWSLI